MTGRVSNKENRVLDGRPQSVREPIALVPNRLKLETLSQPVGRLAYMTAGRVGRHPHARFAGRGDPPSVPAPHERALDPNVEILVLTIWMNLESPRQRCRRWLVPAPTEHAPPPQSVNHKWRLEYATVSDN